MRQHQRKTSQWRSEYQWRRISNEKATMGSLNSLAANETRQRSGGNGGGGKQIAAARREKGRRISAAGGGIALTYVAY